MDFKQLESFLMIAQLGSFSKAEETEYISKQALLKQINNLEAEVGMRLFERGGSGVRLTREGKVFQEGARQLISAQKALVNECREMAHYTEILNLSNVEHQKLLTPVIRVFQQKYPDIHLNYVIHPNHSGEYRVKNRIMDIAETFYDPDFSSSVELTQKEPQIKYYKLASFPYTAVMSPSHPLAARDRISFTDLRTYDVTYFSQITRKAICRELEITFTGCESRLHIRKDVDNQIPVTFECIQNQSILVTCNPYIYYMPNICIVPLETDIEQEYGMLTPSTPSPTVVKFTDIALGMYRKNGRNVITSQRDAFRSKSER